MDPGSAHPPAPPEPLTPAPYGRACVACSRAKSKCFYRADGSACERCHRLGRACEQSVSVRKRRARKASSRSAQSPPPRNILEEKLDNVISLLRSQASAKQPDPQMALSGPSNGTTPSTLNTIDEPATPERDPEVFIDTTDSVVHLLRPAHAPVNFDSNPATPLSPISDDVSPHGLSDWEVEQNLNTFRDRLIPVLPCVHIPAAMSASELRREKPFLWLVIMASTTKVVTKQLELAEVFWKIVSRRVVCEHHASLDLLLGIICFASWSHYFKKDKPFMTMLSQMAISMAFELDLHKDSLTGISQSGKTDALSDRQVSTQHERTIEERRTFVALFHLTSATWAGYRKTYPLDPTPYLEECIRILAMGSETGFDTLLASQTRCHMITNQLGSFTRNQSARGWHTAAPSQILRNVLLKELEEIRKDLPIQMQLERSAQQYLISTELKIKEYFLVRSEIGPQSGTSRINRIQDLDCVLSCAERLMGVFSTTPLVNWLGITVDTFTQMTHCLVVLFKLNTLREPNWDLKVVKERADVIQILDQFYDKAQRLPGELGIVDNDGLHRGIFSKTPHIFKTIRMLMWNEMVLEGADTAGTDLGQEAVEVLPTSVGVTAIPDDFIMSLAKEPWLSDLMEYSWDFMDPVDTLEYPFSET